MQEDRQLALGPNGGLVFCMEYLLRNLKWLRDELHEQDDDYFLFDCPGQFNGIFSEVIKNEKIFIYVSCGYPSHLQLFYPGRS